MAYVYQHTWHDNFRSPGSSDGVYFQYSFTGLLFILFLLPHLLRKESSGTGIEVYGIISNEVSPLSSISLQFITLWLIPLRLVR